METAMHRPGSPTRRHAADVRNALVAGRMVVLQVAHPAVGAGVGQYSRFRTDPWGRLREIDRSAQRFLFSGPEVAAAEGERLRRIHRGIRGVDSRGVAYHALDPAVYGWVHAVFFDTTLTMHTLYGTPLSPEEEAQLFLEWREGGRLLGLRDRDMPADVAAYRAFWDDAVANTLEYNDVVRDVLGADNTTPPPPPWASRLPPAIWRTLWRPVGRTSRWLTLAALPPVYRARIPGATWTTDDEARLRRLGAVMRWSAPVLSRART